MQKAQAAQLVQDMARPYGVKVDDKLIETWWNVCLQGADFELASEIINDLMVHNKFMPRPAEFHEIRRRRVARDAKPMALPEQTGEWTPHPEVKEKWMREIRGTLRGNDMQ